jgi:4-amino-4-deoxychorismate lyase
MLAWRNGKSISDTLLSNRGLAYGDGLFETIKVVAGHAQFLELHLQRLQRDCRRLDIALDIAALRADLDNVLHLNRDGILKIVVTRISNERGYSAPRNADGERLLLFYPQYFAVDVRARNGVAVKLCRQTLAEQPVLAGIKHLNRLEQVIARAEWRDPQIAEGLLLDRVGRLIEGTFCNVFLVKDGALFTSRLHRCGVAGVMREIVLQQASQLLLAACERDLVLDDLYTADEVFLTNSVIGIWPVCKIDCLRKPIGDVTIALQQQLNKIIADEIA